MKGAFVLSALLATSAHAVPTASIHWSDCTSTASDRSLADGTTATIVVTARGLSGTIRATDVRVAIRHSGYTGLPEFWRFDPAGCAAGKMTLSPEGMGDCPRLAEPTAILGGFFASETGGGPMLAALYDPVVADPNATYTLATFTFDLTSGACACSDQWQCFQLAAYWMDATGEEHFFAFDRDFVTWNSNNEARCTNGGPLCGNPDDCIDPPNPCAATPTPVRAESWGRVKASYR